MAQFYRSSYPMHGKSGLGSGGETFRYATLASQPEDSESTERPYGEVSGYYFSEHTTPYFRRNGSGKLETTEGWEKSPDYDGMDHPPSLFRYDPPIVHIDEAAVHPTMRSQVIPMMAKIAADYPQAVTIEASSDLSRHSSKLVKKAQSLGLPVSTSPNNPDAEVTNEMDFSEYLVENKRRMSSYEEIPMEEMKSYMEPVRAQLRAYRVSDKVNNNQFQPHLPGM
jgi:hypothetical protein